MQARMSYAQSEGQQQTAVSSQLCAVMGNQDKLSGESAVQPSCSVCRVRTE